MSQGDRHLAFWTKKLTEPSFVYVIQGDGGGPVKVGKAVDVRARMRELQTGNPYHLRLLHVLPGDRSLESQLHYQMRRDRTYGEWFDGPSVERALRFIERLADLMVDGWDGTGRMPDYRDFPGEWRSKRRRGASEVVVRHVEPDPVPDEVARARLAAEWLKRTRRAA